MEWLLEIVLVMLLAATLFHALRLERALGVLKRDRAVLEELVSGFNASTHTAEQGIDRLRVAAEGAGRQIARQTELAQGLKDDLQFLTDRAERTADRLEQAVRSGRVMPGEPPRLVPVCNPPEPEVLGARPAEQRLRSQAERDLLKALRMAR
jgi:hypothetical protein